MSLDKTDSKPSLNCTTCKHNYIDSPFCPKCNTGYSEWKPIEEKEPTEYGLSEKGLETIHKIVIDYATKFGKILVLKADLEKIFETNPYPFGSDKSLKWNSIKRKYLGKKEDADAK